MNIQLPALGMNARRWMCVFGVLFIWLGSCQLTWSQDDEDLYELASEAADTEMEKADELLKEDERVHGKQWLTPERFVTGIVIWGVLQLLVLVLVVRDLLRKRSSWLVIAGWGLAILLVGFLAGVLYWLVQKLRLNKTQDV